VLFLNRKAMCCLHQNRMAKGRQLLEQALEAIAQINSESILAF